MPSRTTTVLISGANSGIGLAAAQLLSKNHGYHVVIGSRNADAGIAAAEALTSSGYLASSVQLDVTSDASIAAAVTKIEKDFGVLDVLINNAGILIDSWLPDTPKKSELSMRELFTKTLDTNFIGAACLTEACLPLLHRSDNPRLIFTSSRMGSLLEAGDQSKAWHNFEARTYDCSKVALNMLMINYDRVLREKGAMVNAICPGLVRTKLTNNVSYGAEPEVGAQRIVELATAEKGGPSGTFSDKDGSVPW